jgi:hypothetical protein
MGRSRELLQSLVPLAGKPGDDRFLTGNGSAAVAHGLWRFAALWLGGFAASRFGRLVACYGALSHCFPQTPGLR